MNTTKPVGTYIAYCVAIFSLLLSTGGCREQQLPLYSGERYIHFECEKDHTPQHVTFNFATDAPLATEGKAILRLTLWGDLFDTNSTFTLHTDGAVLPGGTFAAGAVQAIYELPVQRNAALLNTDYTIRLELKTAAQAKVAPQQYSTATVHVIDKVEKPIWWEQSKAKKLGTYSDVKYRLFIIFMNGKRLETLDGYTGIAFMALVEDFKSWWTKEWHAGRYHYYADDGVTPLYETIQ